jgi:hypothetical protein
MFHIGAYKIEERRPYYSFLAFTSLFEAKSFGEYYHSAEQKESTAAFWEKRPAKF